MFIACSTFSNQQMRTGLLLRSVCSFMHAPSGSNVLWKGPTPLVWMIFDCSWTQCSMSAVELTWDVLKLCPLHSMRTFWETARAPPKPVVLEACSFCCKTSESGRARFDVRDASVLDIIRSMGVNTHSSTDHFNKDFSSMSKDHNIASTGSYGFEVAMAPISAPMSPIGHHAGASDFLRRRRT